MTLDEIFRRFESLDETPSPFRGARGNERADQRQAIPIVRAAGVIQPPVKLADIATGPAAPRTFDEMFAAARETISKLEAERDARELVSIGGAWSPSHHVRRAS